MASAPRRLSPSYLIFFSSRRRHTRYIGDWSSDVCSSDLGGPISSDKTAQATSSAIDACDADDGVVDRIIMEPRSCKFSAKANVCGAPGAPATNCLTSQEAAAIDLIWDGPRNTYGKQVFPGLEIGRAHV